MLQRFLVSMAVETVYENANDADTFQSDRDRTIPGIEGFRIAFLIHIVQIKSLYLIKHYK